MASSLAAFVPFLVLVLGPGGSPKAEQAAVLRNEMDRFRLPADTAPLSYELRITPDYGRSGTDAVEFEGEVDITIAVMRNTTVVTLNSRGLFVYVAYVHEKASKELVDVIDIRYDDDNERIAIRLESELRVGVQYSVNVEYRGTVKNGLNGFYKSAYRVDKGGDSIEWLLVSYLEPTGAREIFPCYDEPAFKTPYVISLTRPDDKNSVSNMPNSTAYIDHSTRLIRDVFDETPPMATHQVAFMVSGFDVTTTAVGVGNNSEIRAFARSDCTDQIRYVSDAAPRMLEVMAEFTTVPYELPKLALFAAPDFKSDAMGNWGLTTYREKYLLLNEMSSAKAYEVGLSTVQRETARQWFGNLVTCSWWDYLWLHDAFAVYFQYFAMNSIYPEWRMDHVFVVEQHQVALANDQTPKRPITASVRTPAEIEEVFYDEESGKSAAFLRMLKFVTNDTIFQQSVARYLKQNTYKSVGPETLFEAFESTISEYDYDFGQNFTITSFMRQWTEQSGYPMINVARVDDTFIITQERFLIDFPNKTVDSSKWFVGLTYTTESVKNFENVKPIAWCSPPVEECAVSAPRDSGWFVFNLQSTGFYRVNYDLENWRSLIGQLNENPSEINVLNRAQLIDDSFNLARAGKLHYSVTLQLSSYLKTEDDVIPWYSAIDGYTYLLERMRRNDTEYSNLRECVSKLSEIIYLKLEEIVQLQNTSDHSVLTGWNAFSSWTCGLDNEKCVQSAFEYYKKWQNGQKIPSDIRDAAFCVGVHVTNESTTWEEMFELYKNTKSPSEKQSAQKALACTDNDDLLTKYLNYIFAENNGPIRSQDFKDVFTAVSSTPKGLNVTIDFLVQNVNRITEQLVDGDELAIFVYSICSSKAALDSEIVRIKSLKDDPTISTKLKVAFDKKYQQVEYNLHWYAKYHEIVNANVFCSSAYTTTEDLPESTTYQQTNSTSQTTSTTSASKTTEEMTSTESSTTLSNSTTESQTTEQISSESSPFSSTSTTPPETTSETTSSFRTSTESNFTSAESSPTNQTSTDRPATTSFSSTEHSTLNETSTEQTETTVYSPTNQTTAYYDSTTTAFPGSSTKTPAEPNSTSTEHSSTTSTGSTKESALTEDTSTAQNSTEPSKITTNVSESTVHSTAHYTEQSETTSPYTVSHGTSETQSTKNRTLSTSTVPYDSTTVLTDRSEEPKAFYEIDFYWYHLIYTLFLIAVICATYIICVYNYRYYKTKKISRL